MAYSAPSPSTTPPPVVQGVSDSGAATSPVVSGSDSLIVQGSGVAGFGGVGMQTPSGVSVMTAALMPSDSALSLMTKWLLAWALFWFVLFLLDRSRVGHALLYYALTLALFFTAVVEWRWFAGVLAPITGGVNAVNPANPIPTGPDSGPIQDSGAPITSGPDSGTIQDTGLNGPNGPTTGTGNGPASATPVSALNGTGLEDTSDLAALTVQPF